MASVSATAKQLPARLVQLAGIPWRVRGFALQRNTCWLSSSVLQPLRNTSVENETVQDMVDQPETAQALKVRPIEETGGCKLGLRAYDR